MFVFSQENVGTNIPVVHIIYRYHIIDISEKKSSKKGLIKIHSLQIVIPLITIKLSPSPDDHQVSGVVDVDPGPDVLTALHGAVLLASTDQAHVGVPLHLARPSGARAHT